LGWGVFFIVAGSIPLLVQAGVVDPAAVRQVWQLWPLILIGIGLGLILQRTRAAALGGLVVAATFGLLVGGWFAAGFGPGASFGACGIGGGNPTTSFPTQSGSLTAGSKVMLDLSCGDFDVAPAAGSGWTVAGTSDDGRPPEITTGDGSLRVQSPRTSGIDIGRRADWQVTLPTDVAIQLDMSANAGSLNANLQGMQISDLSGSVNAGSAVVNMVQVTGLSSIDMSANAGSLKITLPFPQGTVTGSISANAGSVDLCVPSETGLRITSSTSLGSNNFEDQGLTKVGDDTWVRSALVASPNQLVLNVSANLGSVELNPDDGCE
jgi:hypothetical protein